MIYEWKCRLCGTILEVHRSVNEHNVPPREGEIADTDVCYHGWDRYFRKSTLPTVPFQHLRHSGVFADDNGNFAPRKI